MSSPGDARDKVNLWILIAGALIGSSANGAAMRKPRKKAVVLAARVRTQQLRQADGFLAVCLGILVMAYLVLDTDAAWRTVRTPYCMWLARIVGVALRALGSDVSVAGTRVVADGFQLGIERQCDATGVMSILAAGIVAFPATWRAKAIGLVTGLAAVFLINIVRIVLLARVGVVSLAAFEAMHVYVFQVFIVAAAIACFAGWIHAASQGYLARTTEGSEIRR